MSHSSNSQPLQNHQARPILHIEFLTPGGKLHNATISTDWPESPALSGGLFVGDCDKSVEFRHVLTEAVIDLCATTDCAFSSLSLIETGENGTQRLRRMTEAESLPRRPQLRLIRGGRLAISALFLAVWLLCELSPQEALEAAEVGPPAKAAYHRF